MALKYVMSFLVMGLMLGIIGRTEGVTHSVGDSTGWGVPTNSDFYDDWADSKIFRVGDQLSFNWTGTQNVVQVTEQQHDDCIKVTTNVLTTSPAVYRLQTIGKYYFITTIGDQCNRGQELDIEVLPAGPTTPPTPATTPSMPPPSRSAGVTHTVGDAAGWNVPTNNDFYDDWADSKVFRVGDRLSFNWTGTQNNVVEVTEQQHDDCIKVTTNVMTTSPAVYDLTTVGTRYFITTIGDQCNRGQELEIEILPAVSTPTPTTPTPPASTPTPTPPATTPTPTPARPEGVTHTVGDATGWTVPTNNDFYDDWADTKIFRVGDKLSFNWTGVQNVAEVTEQQHDDCIKVTTNVMTTSPAVYELTTVGKRYFITTIGDQCNRGQELEIEILPAVSTPTPTTPTPPASTPTPTPPATTPTPTPPASTPTPTPARPEGVTYTVGDATGWTVPTNNDFYDDWADNKSFRVGDKLSFNWTGVQNVAEVTEQQHDDCIKVTTNVMTTSPAVYELTVGKHFYISTIGNQCDRGQELEIEVLPAATSGTPSNPTSGSSPRPSTASSNTGTQSPNSSGSFRPMVALSAAMSFIVFRFMN